MTNGEKIKEIYPNEEMYEQTPTMTYYGMMRFDTEWWNAEYKEPTTKDDTVVLTFRKGTLKYSCKDYVVYKKDWFRSHYGAEIDIMFGDSQYKEPTTKNKLGVDCVARQDVERYIEGFINEYTSKEELEFINLELDGLKHIPSVKTGHWIDCDNSDDYSADGYDCSVCGVNAEYATSYCPNCGAKMEEAADGQNRDARTL